MIIIERSDYFLGCLKRNNYEEITVTICLNESNTRECLFVCLCVCVFVCVCTFF